MRSSGIKKCNRLLLQRVSGITKCDSYYKVRRSNANNECLKGKNIRLEFLEKQDQDKL